MPAKKSRSRRKKPSSSKAKKPSQINRLLINRWVFLLFALILLTAFYLYQNRDFKPPVLPPPPANALYKQADQPIDKRVDDLLSYMSIEEKIGQMAMVDKSSIKSPIDVSRYGLGAVLSGAGAKPEENTAAGWQAMVSKIKQDAKQSRLGIPIYYGADAIHGHANVPGATVFPHAIGLGASGDAELVEQVARATAQEAAATGVNWNFSPNLDAPEDIRWGRAYESFSSDPALNAKLGESYIKGTQDFVLSSAKHFLAAGSMKWGSSSNKNFKIDQGKTPDNDKLLDEIYLAPYKAAVNAGVGSVMVGLNHWGNERVIDSKYLITDKLKNELGFKGFVVSDWYGVYEFSNRSKYQANVDTIQAGLDMAMLPFDYKGFIKDTRRAVKKGDIAESRIDDAVRRILYQKFSAGLFDNKEPTVSLSAVGMESNRQLARRAAAASAVLLKNNDNTLPLSKDVKHMLIAGSGADNIGRQCGAWTVEWQGIDGNWLPGATSILQGIKQAVSPNTKIEYMLDGNFEDIYKKGIKADVGIVIVSEKPYAEGWGDNPELSLDATDARAIERLKLMSNKLIIVTVSGRPIFMEPQMFKSDAVVAAWLPGSEGAAIADVLFGRQPFRGKLPIAWPVSIEQLPIQADNTTANNTKPLFSEGFGL